MSAQEFGLEIYSGEITRAVRESNFSPATALCCSSIGKEIHIVFKYFEFILTSSHHSRT